MKRLAVVLMLMGCSVPLEPQDPVWGKQQCGHCAMLVSERAPAAQLLLDDGTRIHFDDVGCLVGWVEREKVVPRGQWVRVGDGWMRAEEARYQRASTPMDFGYVGAREGVDWATVRQAALAKSRPEVAR
jgi:hypothetical protein